MVEIFEHRWTEAEVEAIFGLSSSRMRTAQRYNLVKADVMMTGKRHTRVWSMRDIIRVYFADVYSEHAGLSFSVVSQIFAMTSPMNFWDEMLLNNIEGKATSYPTTYIWDKKVVTAKDSDDIYMIGNLVPGKGRDPVVFRPHVYKMTDTEVKNARFNKTPISVTSLDLNPICRKFSLHLKKAKLRA